MSKKEWIYRSDECHATGLYQELSLDECDKNRVILSIENPTDFSVSYHESTTEKVVGKLEVEIPESVLDEIAIAWCKKRKLHGALGGPVGQEWGSP